MTAFIGRKDELLQLRQLLEKRSASLITLKGRRRIGKSRLAQEFAKGYPVYIFSGIPPTRATTAQSERDEFAAQLGQIVSFPVK